VVTEFALPATELTKRLGLLKMIVENPYRRAAIRRQMAAWRGQDLSFAVDTGWGDKFRTEFGSFIAA
jgi:hypothetical protein